MPSELRVEFFRGGLVTFWLEDKQEELVLLPNSLMLALAPAQF